MNRNLFAIVLVGVAFALIFSANRIQSQIEIFVIRKLAEKEPNSGLVDKSGYYSQIIMYLVCNVSTFFVPPLIKRIGNKWSQVIGSISFVCFMLTFLQLNATLLYAASAFLGIGGAILWIANAAYVVEFSSKDELSRNTAILWGMLQTSFISGGVFLLFVTNKGDITDSYKFLYTIFSCVVGLGVMVLAALPSKPMNKEIDANSNGNISEQIEKAGKAQSDSSKSDISSIREEFLSLFRMMKEPIILILMAVFIYAGFEASFYGSIYTLCVQSTLAISKPHPSIVAYISLGIGFGQICGCFTFGHLVKKIGLDKHKIIIVVILVQFSSYLMCILFIPARSTLSPTTDLGYFYASYQYRISIISLIFVI
ncbi:hypothetical protein WR25_08360 isoform B [Diploscapter pachys]|uniref:Major facilitator superfamily (MFS) profile domain-containing protein n=1 Tax=Diploscapter pachys TaxID=2018661 RepID=A0A2A2KGJ6_9BILA|nr:hypothetical protein WR25_08360 isoform B [Diploscapter pachys]